MHWYAAASGLGPEDDLTSGAAIEIEGKLLEKQRIVFAGININEVGELDTANPSFYADFFLWFNYRGDDSATDVVFTNAVKSKLVLGDPVRGDLDHRAKARLVHADEGVVEVERDRAKLAHPGHGPCHAGRPVHRATLAGQMTARLDAALAEVRPLVARARAAVAAHAERVAEAGAGAPANGHAPSGGHVEVVRGVAAELARLGILLRDPARGLVDFPARAPSGRPYWLCWLDGEPAVRWWHWVAEGFAGRAPVSDLPP